MKNLDEVPLNLTGSLLVANPKLQSRYFEKTVILIYNHDKEHGVLGFIINRPTEKTLGEMSSSDQSDFLSHVPLYEGGPVQDDRLLLVAWRYLEEEDNFQLYCGVTEEKAMELQNKYPNIKIQAYIGFAAWDNKQIQRELDQAWWIAAPVNWDCLNHHQNEAIWREMLYLIYPEYKLLPPRPSDALLN